MFELSIKRKESREIIDDVAKINIGAGIALAAADYEWTLNRCILVLGKSPTITLRDKLCDPKINHDELKKIKNKGHLAPVKITETSLVKFLEILLELQQKVPLENALYFL